MKPVAFVIPWFGENLKGGAEQLAWQVSNRLAKKGHTIEVLTTCCASFLDDWSTNHLPAGVEHLDGLVVRRFKVDNRNGGLFNQANTYGLAIPPQDLRPGINPFTFGTGELFVAENINSSALERYLQWHKKKYHAFVFLPYLYGVVLNGLPLVAEQSWLQPCLHDEVYAYLPEVENVMRRCRGILYNSLGEQCLAEHLFGPGIGRKGEVVGVGVESFDLLPGELPKQVAGHQLDREKYVLCLGRRDKTKNTVMLVEAFQNYRKSHPESSLQLLIAGPGEGSFGVAVKGVHDLGLVSELDKEALLSNCTALFQPSRNESYSRVIMEAWFYNRPVAAHGECLATAMAVEAAGGGWLAEDRQEWEQLFHSLNEMKEDELLEFGKRGREYARRYAEWDAVIDRYETVLGLLSPQMEQEKEPLKKSDLRTIHQLVPGFAYGDAISNQTIIIRDILRSQGYHSEIFTEQIDPSMTHEARLFKNGKGIKADVGLIYHHSIGAGLTDFVINHPGPKSLIYHNVTPPELVRDADPELAKKLEKGLRDLHQLAPHFPVSAGDSRFNSLDLEKNGFSSPSVLPICVAPEKWNIRAEPNMMTRLQDGKDNILFVGRLAANKCQHDLIDVFATYLSLYGNCRLILVGGFIEEEAYYQSLKAQVRKLGLEGDVLFTGKVPDSALHACYRCAHLFWSMSEHEGFGVPLIEAMWFDIPVFAYKSSAVPETLGEGGLLFTDKKDRQELAVTAKILMHDPDVRSRIFSGQKRRRNVFLPESIRLQLGKFIRGMNV
ncbi:MAG: glycosyltransferase [Proteobacteria bacterium]|nr:glycosyltransferase [Pseudomonadota bacterium]MBU1060648.1 glycosyltransferase [Pseudomonadota bacterium]